MTFIVRPVPQTDALAASAAPVVEAMTKAGVFVDTARAGSWLQYILQQRNVGAITLATACEVARQIMTQIAPASVRDQFAALALVECLGRVDTSSLSLRCLNALYSQTQALYLDLTSGRVTGRGQLDTNVAARIASLGASCADSKPYLQYLMRVADALSALLVS